MTVPTQEKGTRLNINTQGKTLLSALVGAIIGSCASLHIYHTLLGGADQAKQIDQLEVTAEHSRKTTDELLARHSELLAKLDSGEFFQKALAARMEAAPEQAGKALSSKPTQRELDDALNGMFEDVADIPATEATVASDVEPKADKGEADAPVEQEKAPVEAGAGAVENGGGDSAGASDEAAK